MSSLEAFILEHEGDDPVRLLLQRDRYPGIDLDLAVNTLEARRRLRGKVPEWYAVPSLLYPTRLCAEQCSSTPTARYKAHVAAGAGRGDITCGHPRPHKREGPAAAGSGRGRSEAETVYAPLPAPALTRTGRIADLTGGLGVDSWAFSELFEEVLYNEADEKLCQAARHNFAALGLSNISVQHGRVEPGKVQELLGGFRPDILYLDPARRSDDGRKVFLLEDCRPDVAALLPELLEAAPALLLKLSPMADISLLCRQLPHVKAVHVVASGGECKELLLLIVRGYEGGYTLTAVEDGAALSWTPEEEADAPLILPEDLPAGFLFEPGKALAKAGAFRLLCTRFGLTKLAPHTHLYTAPERPESLAGLGKCFVIQEVMPLNKRSMKEAGRRWPRAEVTARNLPLSSDELRRRIGCASGGSVHLFGLRIHLPSGPANFLLAAGICEE